MKSRITTAVFVLWGASTVLMAQDANTILNSAHNLSASGPGAIRATTQQQVCIFCHTPHNASPIQPLWNRHMPVTTYTVYSSNSLDALPGQPTGSSKLCLSCHDGTVALGSVVSQNQPIMIAGGITTLPKGSTNLGTDLSDDHPVSFRYDTLLASQDTNLADPGLLPQNVPLDRAQEMQCTSCHDAHNNQYGQFLVMDNQNSQLCATCHKTGPTSITAHSDCASCHQVHTAPSGPYLLMAATVGQTCQTCHDGSTSAPNIAPDLRKASSHDTDSSVDIPDPLPDHVGCSDCHQPHTMNQGTANAPGIPPNFGRIDGVSTTGAFITQAQYEYQVCFKCHADQSTTQSWISRQIAQNNTRLEFSPNAVSFHPVASTGKNSFVPSLKPGLTTASRVYCSDCHNSNSGSKAGGFGSDGVHGSDERPLLVARYATQDYTSENATAYALCYRCHERSSILNDDSFSLHKKHIDGERATCSTCHDAHGISSAQGNSTQNSNLINFDTSVVFPSRMQMGSGPSFTDLGFRSGSCTLSCHGEDHKNETYDQNGD
jgi:predicted CXXCH cytochrome family protein